MGKCYQNLKEYRNAIKCFKKVLETAWFIGDINAELDAYGNISLQYFYVGGHLGKA